MTIDFEVHVDFPVLSEQLSKAKKIYSTGSGDFLLDRRLLDKRDIEYLYPTNADNDNHVSRSEWVLYQKIQKQLEPGNVYVKNSLQYKPLSDYLTPLAMISGMQNTTAMRLSFSKHYATIHLLLLEQQLMNKMAVAGQGIANNNNQYVELVSKGKHFKWHRPYGIEYTGCFTIP